MKIWQEDGQSLPHIIFSDSTQVGYTEITSIPNYVELGTKYGLTLNQVVIYSLDEVVDWPTHTQSEKDLIIDIVESNTFTASITTQVRDDLTAPYNGFEVFNTDTNTLEYWDGSAWQQIQAGGSSGALYFHAELAGQATSTPGQFAKASDAGITANPSGKALTSSGDPGLNNGGTIGFLVPEAGKSIKKVIVKTSGLAVSTGTVGSPILRMRFYRQNYSTRTQIGSDVDLTVNPTGVGIWNDTSGDAFQVLISGDLSISVAQGDLIAWEFVPVTGNNGINAVSRLVSIVKLA